MPPVKHISLLLSRSFLRRHAKTWFPSYRLKDKRLSTVPKPLQKPPPIKYTAWKCGSPGVFEKLPIDHIGDVPTMRVTPFEIENQGFESLIDEFMTRLKIGIFLNLAGN